MGNDRIDCRILTLIGLRPRSSEPDRAGRSGPVGCSGKKPNVRCLSSRASGVRHWVFRFIFDHQQCANHSASLGGEKVVGSTSGRGAHHLDSGPALHARAKEGSRRKNLPPAGTQQDDIRCKGQDCRYVSRFQIREGSRCPWPDFGGRQQNASGKTPLSERHEPRTIGPDTGKAGVVGGFKFHGRQRRLRVERARSNRCG